MLPIAPRTTPHPESVPRMDRWMGGWMRTSQQSNARWAGGWVGGRNTLLAQCEGPHLWQQQLWALEGDTQWAVSKARHVVVEFGQQGLKLGALLGKSAAGIPRSATQAELSMCFDASLWTMHHGLRLTCRAVSRSRRRAAPFHGLRAQCGTAGWRVQSLARRTQFGLAGPKTAAMSQC